MENVYGKSVGTLKYTHLQRSFHAAATPGSEDATARENTRNKGLRSRCAYQVPCNRCQFVQVTVLPELKRVRRTTSRHRSVVDVLWIPAEDTGLCCQFRSSAKYCTNCDLVVSETLTERGVASVKAIAFDEDD